MDNNTQDKYIKFLEQVREEKGLTGLIDFASATCLKRTGAKELFETKSFLSANIDTLIKICRGLDISPNFILMDENGVIEDFVTAPTTVTQAPVSTSQVEGNATAVQSPNNTEEKELLAREMALLEQEEALLQKKKAFVARQLNSL